MIGTFEEAVDRVVTLLDSRVLLPTIFWLHSEEFEGRLTVDPDAAVEALRRWEQERQEPEPGPEG